MASCKSFCWILVLFCGAAQAHVLYVKEYLQGLEPFELNEFLLGAFSTKSFNGSWLTGKDLIYRDRENNFMIYDVNSKEATQYLSKDVLEGYPGASITISKDMNFVALRYNVSSVFRHSTTALFTIYDVKNSEYYDIADKKPIQLFAWSPVGHGFVYVLNNNIYFVDNPANVGSPKAITTDGVPGVVYNGVPDWVYEEEVLGSGSALWFSPNGQNLAFAQFNDTEVEEFDYSIYGQPGDPEYLYPHIAKVRYPKVGTTNPTVKVFAVNLETPTVDLQEVAAIPARFLPDDYVLFEITWPNNEELMAISTNRVQNEGELTRCSVSSGCKQEMAYKEDRGWLDAKIPKYSKNGSERLEILPQPEGDDEFDHLVLTEVATNNPIRLTGGRFLVTAVLEWDEDNDTIYFVGSGIDAPSQQHVYSVVSTSSPKLTCLSCNWTTPSGLCKFASASFSKDYSKYVRVCTGPGPHHVEILNTLDTVPEMVWEDNAELLDRLATKAQPLVKDVKITVTGGFEANARMLLPPDLDETGSVKYPAIVNVYGGPDSNQIKDSYSSGFQNYIVTNRRYIYIYIDGRGSGRDGKNKMFEIYRRMGTVEVEDQIDVTRCLQQNFPFIDAERTGIWGWSYGGFSSAWALVQDTGNVFRFALSVAPVTNFVLYDSIYTERYMGLPTEADNLAGYRNTDVSRNVTALAGKLYFLIHGNADDNVHYQQSMLLSRALELADIPFRQQSYPDENHSLGGVSPHLYHTIDRFWARGFGLPDPPAPRLPLISNNNYSGC